MVPQMLAKQCSIYMGSKVAARVLVPQVVSRWLLSSCDSILGGCKVFLSLWHTLLW